MHQESRTPPPPASPRPEGILVVDDEPAIRQLFVLLLECQGYPVLAVESGAAALALVAASPATRIDLLITDLSMPGMSGGELARALGESRPGLKVIFTSGYSIEDPMVTELDMARATFLPKPVTSRAMSAAIDQLFAHAPALSR